MKNKLFRFTNKIHPLVWQVVCLIISIVFYIVILENRSPNILRLLSISLRTSFGVVILVTTLLIYLAYRIPGKVGQLISMAATLSLFAMPLTGVWASGLTQSVMISGLIPVVDATMYYVDALRILNGIDISSFSAMRPFFPGFLALLLGITSHNLMSALAILSALMGIASHIATREIQKTHGAEPAILFLMLMFLYYRHHSGTTLSESLAVTVSLLGLALIWRGAYLKKEWLFLFGLTITAIALNIRPGAMFILPALLLWGGWYFRGNKKFSFTIFIAGVLLIVSVFLLNSLTIRILAGPNGVAFANFSWALYGLASGGRSYTYIFQAHPEVFLLDPQAQNPAIYKLILDLIFQNPSLIFKGAFQYWRMFFSSTWYNAFSFAAGDNFIVNEVARWSMYFLCALGLLKWWKDRADVFASLIGLAALGVLASVPFVPPTDAYRVRLYAATIPIFGLLPALGIAYLRDRLNLRIFPASMPEVIADNFAVQFCILLLITLLASPLIMKLNNQPPILESVSCPANMDMVTVRYDAGTYVNITRENVVYLDWMPNFHISDFRRNSHNLSDINFIQVMETISPPSTLFYALDFQTKGEVLVIMETDNLPETGQLLSICGEWAEDSTASAYRVFYGSFPAAK